MSAPPERPAMPPRTLLILGVLLVATVMVYLPGLDGPLVLDDRANLSPLAAVGRGDLAPWAFIMDDSALFRPLSRASFLLDWWLWGDQVRAFKATNLALHLFAGLLAFALARALFGIREDAKTATGVALGVCALWLLSPMLVSTVLYTVQRMAQLAALFSLAGLLCYVHGRRRGNWRPVIVTFTVCWPLATLSKENGALLPLLVAVVEWWWLTPDPMGRRARRLLAVLIGVPATLALARTVVDPGWILAGYQGRDFTLTERLLTQPRVLLDYLGNLLLVPGTSPLGLLRDDVAASSSLTDPPTTFLAVLGLAIGGAAALATRNSRFAGAGSGLAFFLAGHALESSVFSLELYFEHRNYLPAFGVYLGTGALVVMARRAAPRGLLAAATLMVILFAVTAAQRVLVWRSEAHLYANAVQTHPDSSRAWLGLAAAQFAAGSFEHGTRSLDRAAALLPATARAGVALQLLAAHCAASRVPDASVYRRLERERQLGGDLFTVNALAWMAGATAAGRCSELDAARVRAALQRLQAVSIEWDPARAALRSAHLHRLLRALEGEGTGSGSSEN